MDTKIWNATRFLYGTINCIAILLLASCGHLGTQSPKNTARDSVDAEAFQTQAEINEDCYNDYIANDDSVENEFQQIVKEFSQYQTEFKKEKSVWEAYQNAVQKVSRCEDHGSSTPMYVSEVLQQAVQLREISLHNMYLHTLGKALSYRKNIFSQTMISDAYSAFIKAVGEDEYNNRKSEYQDALRKEQKCWDEWINCRNTISQNLTEDLKQAYDISTNLMLRTKLYQLKNQNRNLGMISGEIMKCALPEDCSDKTLLEYPGFDKVWAKHCKDTDWYPAFDK